MNEWVMVVDDDSNNLRTASRILMEQKMRASCVKSGEEAIRFLSAGDKHPDLILLDIQNNHKSGNSLKRRNRMSDSSIIYSKA